MEYCLGSASDLLEGKFYIVFDFLLLVPLLSIVGGCFLTDWYFADGRGGLSLLLHSVGRMPVFVIPRVS